MKQGEIWWVCFDPSVGHEFQKKRPAVIISSNHTIKYASVITVMPITSSLNNSLNDDIRIFKNGKNNLFLDSVIKVCHIYSFDNSRGRFLRKVGIVDEDILAKIKE